ncbi:unnamed protein product [Echinostoma caproni]|uniref:Similar to n=1 Tax=Echinostoma caproni TaxID=27848 RepID=A0A183AC07_9TREM|nr:unnamed protein product [Echinostoma caproni]
MRVLGFTFGQNHALANKYGFNNKQLIPPQSISGRAGRQQLNNRGKNQLRGPAASSSPYANGPTGVIMHEMDEAEDGCYWNDGVVDPMFNDIPMIANGVCRTGRRLPITQSAVRPGYPSVDEDSGWMSHSSTQLNHDSEFQSRVFGRRRHLPRSPRDPLELDRPPSPAYSYAGVDPVVPGDYNGVVPDVSEVEDYDSDPLGYNSRPKSGRYRSGVIQRQITGPYEWTDEQPIWYDMEDQTVHRDQVYEERPIRRRPRSRNHRFYSEPDSADPMMPDDAYRPEWINDGMLSDFSLMEQDWAKDRSTMANDRVPPTEPDELWHTPDTLRRYPPYALSPGHSDFYGPYSDLDAEGWRDEVDYPGYHQDETPWSDYVPTAAEWDENVRGDWAAPVNEPFRNFGFR